MLRSSGIQFSETYFLRSELRVEEEKYFSDESFFQEAVAVAKSKSGLSSGDFFLAVAGKSAEFRAVNNALNAGSCLEHLVLTPPVIVF